MLDAYNKGDKEIEDWHSQGLSAVGMETSSTYAVAEHFGMDRISILYAFDNPRLKEHIMTRDSDNVERRVEGNKRMMDLVLYLIRGYTNRQVFALAMKVRFLRIAGRSEPQTTLRT